jgi:hypothetical protein
MKVVRQEAEEDRGDGLDWSAEGIARRGRQIDRTCGERAVGSLLQPPVSGTARRGSFARTPTTLRSNNWFVREHLSLSRHSNTSEMCRTVASRK